MSITSSWAIRLFVSVAVLAALLAFVPLAQLGAAIATVPPGLWMVALALFLAGHAVAAFKWQLLLGHQGQIPARVWLRAHFAGLAANLCLPGVAGGDVVRAAWIRRSVGSVEQVAVAAVVDRLLDCVALVALATLGVAMSGGRTVDVRALLIIVLGGSSALAVAVAIGLILFRSRFRDTGILQRVTAAGRLLATRPAVPLACLALSLGVQTLFVLINVRLGAAVGVDVAAAGWLVAWPLAKLVALAPISLAGLGVREAALVALMRPYGAPAALVAAAGLVWQSILVAGGLIGWLAGSSMVMRSSVSERKKALES